MPLNRIFPVIISAMMQPTDQMSTEIHISAPQTSIAFIFMRVKRRGHARDHIWKTSIHDQDECTQA